MAILRKYEMRSPADDIEERRPELIFADSEAEETHGKEWPT